MTTNTNYPQLTTEVLSGERLIEMITNLGNLKIKLFPQEAPKTVENFLTHIQNNYYDDLTFHRVIKDFMIQGGDPTGTGMGGESIWGDTFEDEFSNKLFHFYGALSMANAGPNTNGSQFFIVQAKKESKAMLKKYDEEIQKAYMSKGGTSWLDNKHTVFGQVIEGFEVLDALASIKTNFRDQPKETCVIKKINILN